MAYQAASEIPRPAGKAAATDRDAELVTAAKQNSREAWETIYDAHYETIFRYVLGRVGTRETAEDLAATVFLEAFRGIQSYSYHGRPLLAWLYTIARNLSNYHHRSSHRRGALAPPAAAETDVADLPGGQDPASLIGGWDLRQAMSRLSDAHREVLLLRYFAGLSTPEAARVLAKQERAVYSLHARALVALRRELGETLEKPHSGRVVSASPGNN